MVNLGCCCSQGNIIVFYDFFCPKQGQGFKPSAAHLFPNIGWVKTMQSWSKNNNENEKVKVTTAVSFLELYMPIAFESGGRKVFDL